jgi:hypothetical protein
VGYSYGHRHSTPAYASTAKPETRRWKVLARISAVKFDDI